MLPERERVGVKARTWVLKDVSTGVSEDEA